MTTIAANMSFNDVRLLTLMKALSMLHNDRPTYMHSFNVTESHVERVIQALIVEHNCTRQSLVGLYVSCHSHAAHMT